MNPGIHKNRRKNSDLFKITQKCNVGLTFDNHSIYFTVFTE